MKNNKNYLIKQGRRSKTKKRIEKLFKFSDNIANLKELKNYNNGDVSINRECSKL